MKKIFAALVAAAFASGAAFTATAVQAKTEKPGQHAGTAGAKKVAKKAGDKAAPQKRRTAKSKRPLKPARPA